MARDAKGEVCTDSGDRSDTFVEAQRWIAQSGIHAIVVPFADAFLPFLPKGSPSIQRSFPLLLSAIKACAMLHQRQRELDDQGRVIATLDDYEMVVPLLDDCFKLLASGGLTPAVRRVVEAVVAGEEISLSSLAKRLDRAKSTVSEQVHQAIEGGWLGNLECQKGLPSRLVRKDPLPDGNVSGLPSVDQLQRMRSATKSPTVSLLTLNEINA